MTNKQLTTGWDRRLQELKSKHAFVMGGFVVLTDHLKKLLACLNGGASAEAQAKARQTNESKMKIPRANCTAADDLEIDKLDADTPGDENKHILRHRWFLRRCDVYLGCPSVK